MGQFVVQYIYEYTETRMHMHVCVYLYIYFVLCLKGIFASPPTQKDNI